MKEHKYLLNMGLAFDEARITRKLGAMAKEGWILSGMDGFRYKLTKEKPQDLIYSMDYRELAGEEDPDAYFELFEQAGWSRKCSFGPYHFFSAVPGTVPIYTDTESRRMKYAKLQRTCFKLMAVSFAALAAVLILEAFIGNDLDSSLPGDLLAAAGALSVMVAVPSIMVSIALGYRAGKETLE